MFSGTIRTRDRLRFGGDLEDKVTAISGLRAGLAVQRPSVSAGESESSGGSPRSRSATASARPEPTDQTHHFAPPTLESVVVADELRRPRAASRRARAARRAGPADQRPAGRHPPGALGLALRRGPEGSHPGDAGKRVRHRRHIPRDDADLHRAARSAPARPIEILHAETNPFLATIGLRIDPAPNRLGHRLPAAGRSSRTSRCTSTRRVDSFAEHMDAVRPRRRCGRVSSVGRSPTAS